MRHKMKVPLMKQLNQTECGLCCCVMILRYYQSKESLKELQNETKVGRDGMSVKQLKKIFVNRGLESKIFKVQDTEFLKSIKEPFIALWDRKHFIVIEKFKNNKWYIKDPAEGAVKFDDDKFKEKYSQVIITVELTDEFKPQLKSKHNMWLDTLSVLLKKKFLLFQIAVLMIITYIFTLQIPILMQRIIDQTLSDSNVSHLRNFTMIILFCSIVYFICVFIRGMKLVVLNIFLGQKLEANTFKNLLKLKYKFFEMRTTGDILFKLNSTSGIKELVASQIINGLIDIGTIAIIIIYMFNKSVLLSFVSIIIFCLNFILMLVIQPFLTQTINNELTEKTKSQAQQIETLSSITTIKINCLEDEIYNNWAKKYKNVIDTFSKRMNINNLSSTISGTIQVFAPIVILVIGIMEYFQASMTIGEVIAFQSIASSFFALSTNIFNMYSQYILATEYLERVADIWYSENDDIQSGVLEKEIEGHIKICNLTYSYSENSVEVLKNINIDIEAGTQVAFVGTSGSGKSTLSKIIVGLYEPIHGEILYDSMPYKMYNKKFINSQMGIVPQDAMLFNKTIFENIVMNNENLAINDVKKMTKITCIDEEIEAMPMGYNTVISEMGLNLSGGQRQRILLARTLLNNPKIIVLDEATSSLDYINEKAISEYLYQKGVTRIIIAHRLSTIVESDNIFVFSDGRVIESGRHDELLAESGEYKRLYSSGITANP